MPGQINLPLHSHTGGDLHGGVSELMATYVVRSCRSAAWSSRRSSDLAMNKSISVSSPMRCSTLWSVRDLDGSVSKRGWCGGGIFPVVDLCSGASSLRRRFLQRRSGAREVVQEYAQTAVCACHSWKMVYPVLVLWLEADSSGFFLRRCSRAGMSVLELDGVSGDMLPRSDSFNGNGFASGKRLWRSVKLLISDGATSSSGVEVICLHPFGGHFGGVEGGR